MKSLGVKQKNLKLRRDNSSQINAGLVILAFGIMGIILPFANFNILFPGINEGTIYVFREISLLALIIELVIVAVPSEFIEIAIFSWGLGGLVASIIYSKDGINGPFYTSIILFKTFIGLLPVVFILIFFNFLDLDLQMMYIFAQTLVILVISLPLAIISSITYRLGLLVLPK